MAHLRITRQHPGYWAIHLDGVVVGHVRGAKQLGYTWTGPAGTHSTYAEGTLGEAVDSLVDFTRRHVKAVA